MRACRGRTRVPRSERAGLQYRQLAVEVVDGWPGRCWRRRVGTRDPKGYLIRLRREAPELDDLAARYVREALRAFNARCYLACSVMLGVASEQAFRGLAEAFVDANGEQDRRLGRLLLNPRSTCATRFEEFRKRLEPLRSTLPHDLADVLTLDAVAELLRITRNSVGHPTGADVDEDTAGVHLQMAGLYLPISAEDDRPARPFRGPDDRVGWLADGAPARPGRTARSHLGRGPRAVPVADPLRDTGAGTTETPRRRRGGLRFRDRSAARFTAETAFVSGVPLCGRRLDCQAVASS